MLPLHHGGILRPRRVFHAGHFPSFRAASNRKKRGCRSVCALTHHAAWNHTLADPAGFGPALRESKSRALPLGYGPVYRFPRWGQRHFTEKHRIGLPYLCYSLLTGPPGLTGRYLALTVVFDAPALASFGLWCRRVESNHPHRKGSPARTACGICPASPGVFIISLSLWVWPMVNTI